MLTVRGATKTFPAGGQPVRALQDVDVDVAEGGCTAILGPSGSGKTTLLRAIAGFERLDAGEVRMEGRVLDAHGRHVAPERRGIGMLAQQGALFPHLDVAANVGFGLASSRRARWARSTRMASARRVSESLELVGLAGYERRRVHELSGGQQQRVALARALAPGPRVVLLDEPFSALDAALRAELREEVRELLQRLGATVVLVTHDQQEALSLADHVVVMRDGGVVQAGSPESVYEAPEDPRTAMFLGDAVVLRARLAETAPDGTSGMVGDEAACLSAPMQAECALGRVEVRDPTPALGRPGGECVLMLRPEQLRLASAGAAGRVVGGSFFGHDALVRVRLGDEGEGPLVLVRTMRERLPAVGEAVRLSVSGPGTLYPAERSQAAGAEARERPRAAAGGEVAWSPAGARPSHHLVAS